MDSRIATPEEHAAWKLELKTLLEQNGVSQDLTSRCLRLFGQALEVNPNKPVGWPQILDVLLSFQEVVAEEGYGTAWNNQSGEIECFEGATKIDIALAYMNKIHNQHSKPFARKAEDLLFEANVQEDVFEKACEILERIQYNYYFDDSAASTAPATTPAEKEPALPAFTDVNGWFLTLEPGRQKVLREDKWMLAGAAYKAGLAARPAFSVPLPGEGSKLRCIAKWAAGALVFEEGREYEVKRLQDGIIDIYNDSVGSYATLALDKLGMIFEVTHYAAESQIPSAQVTQLSEHYLSALEQFESDGETFVRLYDVRDLLQEIARATQAQTPIRMVRTKGAELWESVDAETFEHCVVEGSYECREFFAAPVIQLEENPLVNAAREFFEAKQAKEDFERENPGNSTKRWDACLYRIEAAEDALRAALASQGDKA